MSLLSWLLARFRKKKEPQSGKLQLHFEYSADGPITCWVQWPTGMGEEIDQLIAKDFGQLLAILGLGNLLGLAQHAVVVAGQANNADKVAKDILHQSNRMIASVRGTAPKGQSGQALVPATECFPSSRNRGETNDD